MVNPADEWCDQCFTEDVVYIEHILGNKIGRETVREWIKPTMEEFPNMTRRTSGTP